MDRDFKKEEVQELAERLFIHLLPNKVSGDKIEPLAEAAIRAAMTFRMIEDKVFGKETCVVPRKVVVVPQD